MPNRNSVKVDRDVDTLRETVLRMAARAEAVFEKSLRAVWNRDPKLSDEVVADDIEIDQLDVKIDELVLRTLALDAPVASDLRLVVAIKSIATDLERVGDIARNIAGCGRRLAERDPVATPQSLRNLADDSRRALRDSIEALSDLDTALARGILDADDQIDELEDQVIREAMSRLAAKPETSEQEIDIIFIAQNLERVGDHATNIAEEVVLAAESKNLKHLAKLSK